MKPIQCGSYVLFFLGVPLAAPHGHNLALLLEIHSIDALLRQLRGFLVHLLYLVLDQVGGVKAHHLALLLLGILLLEVLFQVVGECARVLLQVEVTYHRSEDLLLTDNAAPEVVILVHAVGDPLTGGLGLIHQVLAVGQVAADLPAYHHGQLINRDLRGRPVVPPVVIVRPTDRIELIRVLVLDGLLPQAVLNLQGRELEMCLPLARTGWAAPRPCSSCMITRTPLSLMLSLMADIYNYNYAMKA